MSDEKHQQSGGISNKLSVEVSERTLAILALVFSVAAAMLALWSVDSDRTGRQNSTDKWMLVREGLEKDQRGVREELEKAQREVRVLQQISMDRDALLIREGLLLPSDATNGPAYNLQYKPRGKK